MAKNHQIRWTRSDYTKLSRAVKSFNKRVTTEIEKNKQDQLYNRYLPELKSYQDIKSNIYTRTELNRVIEQLKRVNKKGALDMIYTTAGEATTRYELAETRRQANIYKKSLEKQLKELPIPEANTMGSEERREIIAQIRDVTFFEQKKGYEYQKLKNKIQKKGTADYDFKMQITFKNNFLTALKDNYSNQLNFDELFSYLSSKNPTEFYNYIRDNNLIDFLAVGWYSSDKDKYYQLLVKTGLNYVYEPSGGKAYLKDTFEYQSSKGKKQDIKVIPDKKRRS